MINIKSTDKPRIELYGIFGKFETPDSDLTIEYFSTFANNKQANHKALLRELKPMRERLNTSQIDDISALLQRDLDDLRVAFSLVPYLQNKINGVEKSADHVAFFPAILSVLIPNGFIENKVSEYPLESINKDELIDFIDNSGNDYWSIQRFKGSNGELTPLGLLKIDTSITQLIVLDGQHRANAFRVLTGSFLEEKDNIPYAPFYDRIDVDENYSSDLPVTIIWFKSKTKTIDPKLISRELFIAVNNNARPIGGSRKILLNDNEPSTLLTRFYFSYVAKNYSFNTDSNNLSLLHLGFDVTTDLKDSSPHIFTITTPEIVHYIVDWMHFGSKRYNDLKLYYVAKENKRTDTSQFGELMPNSLDYIETSNDNISGENKLIISNNSDFQVIQQDFEEKSLKIFITLFENFNFLKLHFQATSKIQKLREDEWVMSRNFILVWDEVFKGGEGLYYAYSNYKTDNKQVKEIRKTITAITDQFSSERAKLFSEEEKIVNQAFNSFKTKAFQVGFFMAFLEFEKRSKIADIDQNLIEFSNRINQIPVNIWLTLLTSIRSLIIKETNPKSWPSYQKLILRMIQKDDEFYNIEQYKCHSPEVQIFKNKFLSRCQGDAKEKSKIFKELKIGDFSMDSIERYINEEREEIKKIFKDSLQINILKGINWKDIALSELKKQLKDEDE